MYVEKAAKTTFYKKFVRITLMTLTPSKFFDAQLRLLIGLMHLINIYAEPGFLFGFFKVGFIKKRVPGTEKCLGSIN